MFHDFDSFPSWRMVMIHMVFINPHLISFKIENWFGLAFKFALKVLATEIKNVKLLVLSHNTLNRNPLQSKLRYSKRTTRESPGCFNQILNFESWKWSPVATFKSWTNKSALSFFDFLLFHLVNAGCNSLNLPPKVKQVKKVQFSPI